MSLNLDSLLNLNIFQTSLLARTRSYDLYKDIYILKFKLEDELKLKG